MKKIQVYQGDITKLPFKVDGIVNAANQQLIPGGGVDGAINQAAGPKLAKAMKKIGGTPTGTAVFTKAYELNADYVIHAVGPIYHDGTHREAELLKQAYQQVMAVTKELALKSVAVPALSTGVYGYPLPEACKIEVETIWENLPEDVMVYLVAFNKNIANELEMNLTPLAHK